MHKMIMPGIQERGQLGFGHETESFVDDFSAKPPLRSFIAIGKTRCSCSNLSFKSEGCSWSFGEMRLCNDRYFLNSAPAIMFSYADYIEIMSRATELPGR